VVTLALLAATLSVARAQDCRSMPPGSQERKACMQSQPGFQARREQCKQLARERGYGPGSGGGGMKGFVQDCVRGRQH